MYQWRRVFELTPFLPARLVPTVCRLRQWGYFSVTEGIHRFQIWRWLTYQFLHHDFWHLLFNMIGLYFFGPLMERWWGSRRFLGFYLMCGFSAAATIHPALLCPGFTQCLARNRIGRSVRVYFWCSDWLRDVVSESTGHAHVSADSYEVEDHGFFLPGDCHVVADGRFSQCWR